MVRDGNIITETLPHGTTGRIAEKYRLAVSLGAGATAEVWKMEPVGGTWLPKAIKIIKRPDGVRGASKARLYLRELLTISDLNVVDIPSSRAISPSWPNLS